MMTRQTVRWISAKPWRSTGRIRFGWLASGKFSGAGQQFYLNVIQPAGHAFKNLLDKKIRMETVMAGPDGAGGQGHVSYAV
jgi:hypothetical protein